MMTIIYKGSEEKLGKSRLEVILGEDLLAFGVGTDRDGQHWRVCVESSHKFVVRFSEKVR